MLPVKNTYPKLKFKSAFQVASSTFLTSTSLFPPGQCCFHAINIATRHHFLPIRIVHNPQEIGEKIKNPIFDPILMKNIVYFVKMTIMHEANLEKIWLKQLKITANVLKLNLF